MDAGGTIVFAYEDKQQHCYITCSVSLVVASTSTAQQYTSQSYMAGRQVEGDSRRGERLFF